MMLSDREIWTKLEGAIASGSVARVREVAQAHGWEVLSWCGGEIGESALNRCLARRDQTLAAEIVRLGANPSGALLPRLGSGDKALHGAAQRGMVGLIEALIRAGAAVDERNACGESVLERAVDSRSVPAIKVLLAAGAWTDRAVRGGGGTGEPRASGGAVGAGRGTRGAARSGWAR